MLDLPTSQLIGVEASDKARSSHDDLVGKPTLFLERAMLSKTSTPYRRKWLLAAGWMAVVAVVVAFAWLATDRYLKVRDARLKQALENLGVGVLFSKEGLCIVVPDANDERLCDVATKAGRRAISLTATGRGVTDGGLHVIGRFPRLKQLSLVDTSVLGTGFAELASTHTVEELFLSRTDVSDTGLIQLSKVYSLRNLSLSRTRITDTGLAHLSSLHQLRRLDLSRTRVTGDGLRHLSALPHFEELKLSNCPVTDDGVRDVVTCKHLCWLDLSDTKLSGNGVRRIGALSDLVWLGLVGVHANNDDFRYLVSRLPRLEHLAVDQKTHSALLKEGVLPPLRWRINEPAITEIPKR
jgi:hypothetical protein